MNAPRDSLTLACLVALAAALLAACGGSGEETAREGEDFAAAADRICATTARNDIAARRGELASQPEYLRQLQRNREEALRELEQLSPPSGEAATGFEEFLARRRVAADAISDGIVAAAEGDAVALDRFRSAARRRVIAGQEAAAELGLSACAGRLGAGERSKVAAAITSSIDHSRAHAFCTEHTSEPMIATHFGSRARCLVEQAQRPLRERVEIDDLRGVAGVSANAIVTISAGGEAAGRFEIALVHEGGSWRYDSVSPAPEPDA